MSETAGKNMMFGCDFFYRFLNLHKLMISLAHHWKWIHATRTHLLKER